MLSPDGDGHDHSLCARVLIRREKLTVLKSFFSRIKIIGLNMKGRLTKHVSDVVRLRNLGYVSEKYDM